MACLGSRAGFGPSRGESTPARSVTRLGLLARTLLFLLVVSLFFAGRFVVATLAALALVYCCSSLVGLSPRLRARFYPFWAIIAAALARRFSFVLDCPPFVWSMLYKLIALVSFFVFWWYHALIVWGFFFLGLFVFLLWWVSAHRAGRAFASWLKANPTALDIPPPFSPRKATAPLPKDPMSERFYLVIFLHCWVTPVLYHCVESVRHWLRSEEHERLMLLLCVTGALPRIPLYLFLCVLSAVCVFAFVPSILDLDLSAFDG